MTRFRPDLNELSRDPIRTKREIRKENLLKGYQRKGFLFTLLGGAEYYPTRSVISTLAGGTIGYVASNALSDARSVPLASSLIGAFSAFALTMVYSKKQLIQRVKQEELEYEQNRIERAELAASAKAQETLDSFTIEPWSEVTPENEQATLLAIATYDARQSQMAASILVAPDNRSDEEKAADRLKYLNSVKLMLEGKAIRIKDRGFYDPSVLLAIPRECIKREYGKGVIKKTDLICPGKLVEVVQGLIEANMKALNL